MKSANGPSNLHSPPSAPGLESPPPVEFEAAVAIASMALEVVEEAKDDDINAGAVDEAAIIASPAGSDVVAAARIEYGASSGSDIRSDQTDKPVSKVTWMPRSKLKSRVNKSILAM